MFHTIIAFAYTIPNLYVFIRIWQLFIDRQYRLPYILVYLFMALIYPLSNYFAGGGFPFSMLYEAAGYILPFYLYLFLSVLVLDFFLLFNRIFRLVSLHRLKSKVFKRYGLAVVVVVPVFIVIAGVINFNTIRTTEYKIDIPARESEISKLKIVFTADFHLNQGVDTSFVRRFVKRVAMIRPDLVIYGGDIIEGHNGDGSMEPFERILSVIKPEFGVYAVLGNHEHYAGQDNGDFFRKAGMTLLRDSCVVINNSINLVGRNDSHVNSRKTADQVLRSVNDSLPVILIDHRPTEIDLVSHLPVDIQLSGHTHNGQLFPINLFTKSMYLLSWGHRKIGNTHFFVTSGIRLWGPPVRTTGKSEIMVINVNFVKG
ncbi:MAG TPA: metallophosphoesterase [Bacteroidales bacterium]|nr:metallophosphoesterase [Bacteroidales bacterium]